MEKEPRDRDPAIPVMVGIISLKNTKEAFAAGDVNALARLVIEKVIGCHVNDSGTLRQSRRITPSKRPASRVTPWAARELDFILAGP